MSAKWSWDILDLQERSKRPWVKTILFRLTFHITVNMIVKLPSFGKGEIKDTPSITTHHTFNTVVVFCSVLRLIYCLSVFQAYDFFQNRYSIRYMNVYFNWNEYLKSFKIYSQVHTKKFILGIMVIPLLILGLLLKIVEKNTESNAESFSYVWNSYWVIILSQTTVGYGDIYPVDNVGRFLCTVA